MQTFDCGHKKESVRRTAVLCQLDDRFIQMVLIRGMQTARLCLMYMHEHLTQLHP